MSAAISTFGRRLRRYRQDQDLTQAEVGERLGVGQVQVSNWETGKDVPTPAEVSEFERRLGLAVSDDDEVVPGQSHVSVEDSEGDDEPFEIPPAQRRLITETSDRKAGDLRAEFERGKLQIQPDFQRHVVWPPKKCSRLIESMILKVPLPVFYVAQSKDSKLEVIDGQQRLSAIFSFLTNGPLLTLKGRRWDGRLRALKVTPEYNGKTFKELPEQVQETILDTNLRVITILQDSEPDVKFEVFERLNTGAVKLNDMEIRNCIYRGEFNEFLKRIASHETFRKLLGTATPDDRMKDVEMALRFIALYELTERKYSGRMKSDLTRFMENNRNPHQNKLDEWEKKWDEALDSTYAVIGPNAFRSFVVGEESDPNGFWQNAKLNLSLFDCIMQNWGKYPKNQLVFRADAIRALWIDIQTSRDFRDTLASGADNQAKVEKRFEMWRVALKELIGAPEDRIRLFSRDVKESLWVESQSCKLCSQTIHEIDDAEVDHVLPWIRGGLTVSENAQLAHRYCNASKGSGKPIATSAPSPQGA